MKYHWLFYFTLRAVRQRPQKIMLMIVSVSLAVGLLISMIVLEAGIRSRVSVELASYGANALVTSANYLDEKMVQILREIDGVVDVIPELYGRACLQDRGVMVNIIGMPLDGTKRIKVYGEYPREGVLIGSRLAEAGGFKIGDRIRLSNVCGSSLQENALIKKELKIEGIFERVGPEDSAIIMKLSTAQEFLGLGNRISLVMLRIDPDRFEKIIEDLKEKFPGFEIKIIRQVAISEESLLRKIQMLMLLVSVVVIIASIISVAGIMAANIFERIIDIGLMKTMGATTRQIQIFFIIESLISGATSSISGLLIGIFSAELISISAFGGMIGIPVSSIPLSFVFGFVISILSKHSTSQEYYPL